MNEQQTAMMESATTILKDMAGSKEFSALIRAQGELMKKTLTQYQAAGFTHDEAFQLVLASHQNEAFQIVSK